MQKSDTESTRRFYDRISSAYDLLADADEHVAREKGLAALAVQPGEHILEIGYGTGHSLVELARLTGPKGKVCGVDISTGMQKTALKRLETEGLADRVDLEVGVVPPIPWPDDSFDVVSMSFTLELFALAEIPGILEEIKRVLRPDGRLGVVAMSVTPEGKMDSFLEKTYKWMHQHFPHAVDCQPIPAVQMLEDAGLTITHHEDLEIWTLPVVVLVSKVSG